ncbi:MAG: GTPase HflX, partial [Pseudomonas fluorescens]
TRGLQRMARQKADVPTVALVGYTNAGKSTLFNRMVDAGTLMADALFATLDPLMRRLELPGGLDVVLVDTVGFIADLPHELVEAFKATLEEVVMADILLQVHDISNPEMDAQSADVRNVLAQIGAADKRVIHVYNKVDKLDNPILPRGGVGVSAVTGQGVDELLEAIRNRLQADWETLTVKVNAGDGRRLAWLHAHGDVTEQHLDEETWTLKVKLRAADLAAWRQMS